MFELHQLFNVSPAASTTEKFLKAQFSTQHFEWVISLESRWGCQHYYFELFCIGAFSLYKHLQKIFFAIMNFPSLKFKESLHSRLELLPVFEISSNILLFHCLSGFSPIPIFAKEQHSV